MQSLWRQNTNTSKAPDVSRLKSQVKNFDVDYQEIGTSDRVRSIRLRWRLFAQPLVTQQLHQAK